MHPVRIAAEIEVAVVGAVDEDIGTEKVRQIGDVIVDLAGDREPPAANHVHGALVPVTEAPERTGTVGAERLTQDVWHPAGAGLEERPSQLWELVHDPSPQEREERAGRSHHVRVQRVAWLPTAVAEIAPDMHGDGQVEVLCFGVEREHGRVREAQPVRLSEEEHGRRAVLLREVQFLERPLHAPDRRESGPPQAAATVRGALGHPTVVAAVHGGFGSRTRHGVEQPPGREQHLDVDTEVVHVLQAGRDVLQVGARKDDVAPFPRHRARPLHLEVLDRPMVAHDHRLEGLLARIHVVPGPRGLDDVGIAVDVAHERASDRSETRPCRNHPTPGLYLPLTPSVASMSGTVSS